MAEVSVSDINLHVEDSGGNGRPVVLIHGWPLSGASWKLQVPALLDAGYRVITYDRRGFGQSDKPEDGYDYDMLTDDLAGIIDALDLHDVTLVGFSMGGGEAARYVGNYGEDRLRSIVLAAAIPPMLMKTEDNPDGPLEKSKADEVAANLDENPDAFYKKFLTDFFSPNADGNVLVDEDQMHEAFALCKQASKKAALGAQHAFSVADFRDDIQKITVPTLVLHGDADAIVPIEGSGELAHQAIVGSELHVIKGGPHGINASHVEEFNSVLLDFLKK